MKKTYLIANWKMQLLNKEAEDLSFEILNKVKKIIPSTRNKNLEIILCPSFTSINSVNKIIQSFFKNKSLSAGAVKGSQGAKAEQVKLGAQNVFYQKKGSYTGEISATQLKELGVKYIILGHSEKRKYLNEKDEDVNKKIIITLKNNLIPIVCVGETLEQRQNNKTDLVLSKQISKAVENVKLKNNQKIIIAYEPIWVIGTGQAVNPKQAEQSTQIIYKTLQKYFTEKIIKNNISIIYGGSVDSENINNFLKMDLIQGVLVGNASLSSEKFIKIIKKIKNNKRN